MKDEHRLRDRVELSLDNRQVFLLFLASAIVIALVFALGVVVGKRLTPEVASKAPSDPLALLDQVGGAAASDDELTFSDALTRAKKTSADAAAAGQSSPAADESTEPDPGNPAAPAAVDKPEPKHAQAKLERALAKVRKARGAGARGGNKDGVSAATPGKRSKHKGAAQAKADDGGSYTLQLSSFQDRREAEQFMSKLRAAGHSPRMVPTELPGRGIWYRVRVGSYRSWDEALAAKTDFEKRQQIIAYVARNP